MANSHTTRGNHEDAARGETKTYDPGAAPDSPSWKTCTIIHIHDYDPEWPRRFEREAMCLRALLGEHLLLIEHVGSTSVPGLAAKPVIDIVLAIADSADELAYVPTLEAAGYVLRIREPDWHEHRMFKGPDTDINLHVFSSDCSEIDRMLLFRNWLRKNASDRQLYEHTKRELALQNWKDIQHYADAKTSVVKEILARAREDADP
jgi:GrpB-like predicted nucleotidyltransferase (UPF0157 family)